MTTGIKSFDTTLQHTKEWLDDVQDVLGWVDENKIFIVTKAVLQTLRERLTVEVAVKLGEQFPTLMKGFYYEGWDPSNNPEKMHIEDFFNRIQKKTVNEPINTAEVTKAVFTMLKKRLSETEMEKLKTNLPKEYWYLF